MLAEVLSFHAEALTTGPQTDTNRESSVLHDDDLSSLALTGNPNKAPGVEGAGPGLLPCFCGNGVDGVPLNPLQHFTQKKLPLAPDSGVAPACTVSPPS
jgi:hypothetical protein